jgi:hypothetical protein
MPNALTIREFWRRTYTLPRAALACATISAALNVSSYAGLGIDWAGGALSVVHLAVMALGLALFVRSGYERTLSVLRRRAQVDVDPMPRRLIWSTVASFGYLVALLIGIAVVYGEGFAEVRDGREVWVVGSSVVRTLPEGSVDAHHARSLRIFSASWIFFGLFIALMAHRVEDRIRALRRDGVSPTV